MTNNSFTENQSVCQSQLIRENFDGTLDQISGIIGRLALTLELLSQVDSLDNFENPDEVVLCGVRSILEDSLVSYRELYGKIDNIYDSSE